MQSNFNYLKEYGKEEIDEYVTNKICDLTEKSTYDALIVDFSIYEFEDNSRPILLNNVKDYSEFIPLDVPIYADSKKINPLYLDDINIYTNFIKFLQTQCKEDITNPSIIICAYYYLDKVFGNLDSFNDKKRQELFYSEKYKDSISIKEYYQNKCGACLERSSLFHNLLTFFDIKDHLIFSYLTDDFGFCDGEHAFNIIEDDKTVLFDSTRSYKFRKDNQFYILPMLKKIADYEKIKEQGSISVNLEENFYEKYPQYKDENGILHKYANNEITYLVASKIPKGGILKESNFTKFDVKRKIKK